MAIIKESTDRTNVSGQPEAFIRNHQYNFIKEQALALVTAHATANDTEVLSVLRHLSHEKVFAMFSALTEEQKNVLRPLTMVKDTDAAEEFLAGLRPYLIPFPTVNLDNLKRLFPKAKKAERAESCGDGFPCLVVFVLAGKHQPFSGGRTQRAPANREWPVRREPQAGRLHDLP